MIDQIKDKYQLDQKYLIYTGSVNWNKNLLNQAEAGLNAGVDLVFVGGGFDNRDSLNHPELRSYKLFLEKYADNPKVHILGYVSHPDLVGLVNGAEAMIYVSYYEGFGLPILEAQNCGVPVITGNISSMKEVAGESALLVDPKNTDQIAVAINHILNNKNLAQQLKQAGRENIKRFSWEKTAQETVKVYQYALSQK